MCKLPYTLSYSQYLGAKEAKKQLTNLKTQRRPRFSINVVLPVFRGPWRPELKSEKRKEQNLVLLFHAFIWMTWAPTNQIGFQFQFLGMHVSVLDAAAVYCGVNIAQ